MTIGASGPESQRAGSNRTRPGPINVPVRIEGGAGAIEGIGPLGPAPAHGGYPTDLFKAENNYHRALLTELPISERSQDTLEKEQRELKPETEAAATVRKRNGGVAPWKALDLDIIREKNAQINLRKHLNDNVARYSRMNTYYVLGSTFGSRRSGI